MPSDREAIPSAGVHRRDDELPPVTVREGWRFHHVGIPTQTRRPGEKYLPRFGFHHSGFESSAYGIEWMRFDDSSPLPEIIRTVPHVAFVVPDLDAALRGREILFAVSSPSPGVRTAMILADGAPIELMEFAKGTAP
jgi:catechol 2,3-dioxygenase-like lactoylglutathione lyase family enzyme